MTDLAKLVVKLEAQTAQYQRELAKSNKKMDTFVKRQEKALKKVDSAFKAFAAGLSAGLFVKITRDSLEFADQIQKLNLRLGASTEFLSEMRFVAEQTGVKFESLTMGLQRMVRRISEAGKGTGEAVKALEEMNLNAEALARLAPEQQYAVIADRLGGLENQADRVRLAMKLFDSEGVALVQTMGEGAAGINKLRAEARSLGLTLTQDAADAAARANDAMNKTRRSVTGLTQTMAIQLGPTIEKLANFMSNNLQPALAFIGRAFNGVRFLIIKVVDAIIREVQRLAKFASYLPGWLGGDWAAQVDQTLQGVRESLQVTGEEFFQAAAGVAKYDSTIRSLPDEITVDTSELDLLQEIDTSKFKSLRKSTDEFMDQIQERTAGVSDQIAGTLVQSFQGGFDSIGDNFKNMLAQMLAQFAQSGIASLLQSFLPGLASGAASGGGLLGLASSFLPGFATGGEFEVGGRGGVDRNVVAFRATRGERVNISRAGEQSAAGGSGPVTFNFAGDVTSAARREIQRMIMDGSISSLMNDQQQQQGGGPVFKTN